jgi:O-antigen/teichoic acid export membrane protein
MSMMSIPSSVITGVRRTVSHPIALSAVSIAGSQYIAAGIGFLTGIVSARILGPKDYGLVAIITAYPALLGALLAVKSSSITTRYVSSFRATGQASALLSVCKFGYALDLLVSIGAFVLVALSGWWVSGYFYNISSFGWLMVTFALSFPFASLAATSISILSSFQQFNHVAGLQVFARIIEFVFVVGLLLSGFGMPGVVLGNAIGSALIGVIAMIVASVMLYREKFDPWWQASLRDARPIRKEMTSLFGWNYFAVTCSGLLEYLPLMLLGYLRGPSEAGFYRLARSIVTAGSYLEASMGKVAYPLLCARLSTANLNGLNQELKRWTLHGGLVLGAFVLVLIPLFPRLIMSIFGDHYVPMASGMQIMMVANAVSATFFWLNSVYYASGKVALWTIANSIQTVLVVGFAWLCIAQWGFLGAASLSTAAKVVFTIGMVLVFRRVAVNP